uniref:C2H2-type domain-containing protein n=1 Tax=Trichogramma kaykai TaxID=54128 RepID=A0ABD2W1Z9_9HYME
MESSSFNCVFRVKKEPTDASLIENNCKMTDEKPDLKSIQLLTFPQENSTYNFRKFEENHESELQDKVEIIVECEDVKPSIELLKVKKIDDDSPNHLRNLKDNGNNKPQSIIKLEPVEEVKQEFVGDINEESNLNSNWELGKPNKKHNFKKYRGILDNNTTQACEIGSKNFSTKSRLNRHDKSLHRCLTASCDICGKKFTVKGKKFRNYESNNSTVY